jgi:uncharacterized protein (DUF305 family)
VILRPLLVVLLAVALAGCGGQAAPEHRHFVEPSAASGEFGPTERAFTELSIATDDQAVKLLSQGERASSPALRALAREIATYRRSESAELHGLLDAAGVAYVNNHEGHDMPGMPTADELAALSASGADFDAVFTRLLHAHLEESTVVVRSVLGATANADTKAVARRMEQERATDLARLAEQPGNA